MSKSKRRLGYFSRHSRFENLEERIVLDSQIGTVTMPYDGYLTVAVYNSSNLNQPIRTLIAQQPEQAGNIPLFWDGKDQLGRNVDATGTYTWKALTSQVNPLNQGEVADSEAVPNKYLVNQGYFVQSLATSVVPGTAGDVGGTFAKSDTESYYGDTSLSTLSLSSSISASGKLFFSDISSMGATHGNNSSDFQALYIGHYSSSTTDTAHEFLGLEFYGNQADSIYAHIRFYGPTYDGAGAGSKSDAIQLPVGSGYFNWDYSYDPSLGTNGRVTAHIYIGSTPYTLTVDLGSGDRASGAAFNSFGMGVSKHESGTGNNAALTGKFFIDDVSYTGHTGTVDFNGASASGWTGSGNTANGNNYGFNSYSNSNGNLTMFSHFEEATNINQISSTGTWLWSQIVGLGLGGAADETYVYESVLDSTVYSTDSFKNGSINDGTGWSGNWSLTGNASVAEAPNIDSPTAGIYYLQLTGNNGVASRAVNMSGVTNAYLSFDWKANSFETGETAVVEIYNGSSWVNVMTVTAGQADNAFHCANIDLSGYTLGSSFQVRFRSQMGDASDFFYVDNVRIASDQYHIYRNFSRDGGPAPFSSTLPYLTVAVNAIDPSPSSEAGYHKTSDEWRTWASTWGMAADGYRIWVSNYRDNYVKVYDRNTGSLLGQYSITKPLSIAVDTANSSSSTVWIVNNGDRVTKLTFTNSGSSFSAGTSITALADPTGLTLGGPNHHLFIAESGTTHIREYDITSTPALVSGVGTLGGTSGMFGSFGLGGPITDSQFDWKPWGNTTSLAIDPNGILSVTDGGGNRIQRFYTTTGGGHNAGDLYDSLFGNGGFPAQAYNFNTITDQWGTRGTHYLASGGYVLQVDPDYTHGPRPGWLGDGTWRVVERYSSGVLDQGPDTQVVVMDGSTPRQLRFFANNNDATIYTVDNTGERLAAILGAQWLGTDRNMIPRYNIVGNITTGLFAWTDTNGDGLIQGGTSGSGTDGEVVWDSSYPNGTPSPLGYFHPAMDSSGNLWFVKNNNLVKVPLEGFATASNGLRNPVYNWSHAVTVLTYQDSQSDPNGHFLPYGIKVAANGDIYALGSTAVTAGPNPGGLASADWIARYNSSGVLQSLTPTLDNTYASMAIDINDANPQYYVTGERTDLNLFTKDGLLVSKFTVGSGTAVGTGSGSPSGWIDGWDELNLFTDPNTGHMYVYAANSFYGDSDRWRIDNLSTVQRSQGDFAYSPTTTLTGHWEFNSSLNDSAGSNTATVGGSTNYAAGQIGNAISLSGSSNYVSIPYAAQPSAYTISAWIKINASGAMNVVSRGNSDGVSFADQLRINSSGKFEHYVYDGGVHTVTGTTTVQTNTWYFVSISATNNGQMHLYVNGTEEGTPQNVGVLWRGGDRFNVGYGVSGFGYLNGLVDDLRIYDHALTSTDISAIYGNTDKPTVSITATDATASEQTTDPGTFLIQRGNTNGNLVVNYTIGGAGTNSSDYSSIAGSITISSGSSAVVITVSPIDDATVEGNETVTLTLATNNSNFTAAPGTLGAATVTIVDNDSTSAPPNGRWPFEDELLYTNAGHEFGMSDFAGSNNGTNQGTPFFEGTIASYPWWYGPATYATGHSGRAVSLDGLDDDITIPYANDATAYTIAAWINPDNTRSTGTPTSASILARTDASLPNLNGTGQVSEQIRINSSGKLEHYTYDGTGHTVTGTTTVTAGNWYFVAITATSNGTMRLYVNGTEENSLGLGNPVSIGNLWTGGDRFNIGANMGGMLSFKGLVDDLQVYDSPLSATQISALYGQSTLVTVSATDASASEPSSDTGTFTITRTGTGAALVVNYNISGTATNGTDYSNLNGTVTIPSGSSTVTVVVTPIDDSTFELDETVALTIASNSNYSVGAPK